MIQIERDRPVWKRAVSEVVDLKCGTIKEVKP